MDRVFARAHRRGRRGAAAPATARVAYPAAGARAATVGRLVTGPRIQAKLRIGAPDDVYEREADRVADRVMRMPDPAVQRMCTDCEEERLQRQPLEEEEEEVLQTKPLVQRMCADCEAEQLQRQPLEEEEEVLQTKPLVQRMCTDCEEEAVQAKEAPGSVPELGPAAAGEIRGLSGGRPLPAAERAFFEPRMGQQLGDVRVHTGPRAEALASAVRARAFTLGRDVVFGRGEYAPGSTCGRRLMAHELTHVLQQNGRGGPIRRQHVADTGWRYTPPATVTRSIEEIQGVVGTTPDGVYGINTKTAVIRYQEVLRDRGFYTDTIDGKWGSNTDVAHEAFATASNVERRGYNCAGFAFKRFTWINLAPTRAIYSGMTQLASCGDRCSAWDHKFWMWEFDINTEDTRTGARSATTRDFHTVGGQTDGNGDGPDHVMSKDGPRPVVGPRSGPAWRPLPREPVVRVDGTQDPFFVWNVSNVDEDCFCSSTLP